MRLPLSGLLSLSTHSFDTSLSSTYSVPGPGLGVQSSALRTHNDDGKPPVCERSRHAHHRRCGVQGQGRHNWGCLADEVFAITGQTRVSVCNLGSIPVPNSTLCRTLCREMNPLRPSHIITCKEVASVSGTGACAVWPGVCSGAGPSALLLVQRPGDPGGKAGAGAE